MTALKDIQVTFPTPDETLLGTPETLPTSEPGTPQTSYTLAAANLPSFSEMSFYKKFIGVVVFGGRYPTGGVLYWRMKKNGASVNTGSFVPASGNYFTGNAFFWDVDVGDVLEIAMWSSVTDSVWDYKAVYGTVTRIIPFNRERVLYPCDFASIKRNYPTLTLGSPYVATTASSIYPYHCGFGLPSIGSENLFWSLYPILPYGTYRINLGDYHYSNSLSYGLNNSYRPYYRRTFLVERLLARGVKID